MRQTRAICTTFGSCAFSTAIPLGREAQVRREQFRRHAIVLRCQRALQATPYASQNAYHQSIPIRYSLNLPQYSLNSCQKVVSARHVEIAKRCQSTLSDVAQTLQRFTKTLAIEDERLLENRHSRYQILEKTLVSVKPMNVLVRQIENGRQLATLFFHNVGDRVAGSQQFLHRVNVGT